MYGLGVPVGGWDDVGWDDEGGSEEVGGSEVGGSDVGAGSSLPPSWLAVAVAPAAMGMAAPPLMV